MSRRTDVFFENGEVILRWARPLNGRWSLQPIEGGLETQVFTGEDARDRAYEAWKQQGGVLCGPNGKVKERAPFKGG